MSLMGNAAMPVLPNTEEASTQQRALLEAKLSQSRSIFAPGHRIKFNVVPMFLATFIPWGIFLWCAGLTSFHLMYRSPAMAYGGVALAGILWLLLSGTAFYARMFEANPTWFTYLAVAVLAAIIGGTLVGTGIFNTYTREYYHIKDLKTFTNLDIGKSNAADMMDAGMLEFQPGNRLDTFKSWHFMSGSLYCVAPIVSDNSPVPLGLSYDFWAVGKDCCSSSDADFRCGSWGAAKAQSGIRVTDDSDIAMYTVAVQQAETLYNINSKHPIFISWSTNAIQEVEFLTQCAFKSYVVSCLFAFICFLFGMSMASARFAWLGRAKTVWQNQFINDADWVSGVGAVPLPGQRGYGSV